MTVDLLWRGGELLDGTGAPAVRADVAVADGRIVALGADLKLPARRTIDASGLIVCPGFIDLHTHSDLLLLAEPEHRPKIMQGVTTEVIGHDGLSYAPVTPAALAWLVELIAPLNGAPDLDYSWRTVAEYLRRFDRRVAVNVAFLVPHGAVRASVVGPAPRPATAAEIAAMADLVAAGLADGAVGFSTGLTYAPCSFAETGELVELCRAAGRRGGVFMPHLRSYGAGIDAALDEAVDIARRSGIALHLTHHQVVFPCNEGRQQHYTDVIDAARAEGLDVTCDSYPYTFGSTWLLGVFPGWAQTRGRAAALELLADETAAARLRRELEVTGCDGTHGVPLDWSKIQLTGVGHDAWRPALGRRVADVAADRGESCWETVRKLLLDCAGQVNIATHFGFEEAVRHILRHPTHTVGSDGILVGERPHPRVWGTFPRVLGRYVRELGVLDWPTAVHHLTGAAAARLGLVDRGRVAVGLAADLVAFDPATVRDRATVEEPCREPEGLPYVMVNGELVKDDDRATGRLPGRALKRRPAARAGDRPRVDDGRF